MGTIYHVRVDDNFHFMSESHSYQRPGAHTTLESALAAAKRMIDEDLEQAYGSTAADLYRSWAQFGDSPWVVASDGSRVAFSASEYAMQRAAAMTQAQ